MAYLWARTVVCKACGATLPLLKTRWLAKKDNKRVILTMRPKEDRSCVVFGIETDAKSQGGNAAQKRYYDKKLGAGTMRRAGAACPCCGTIMTMKDMRLEGRAGRLGAVMTAVVVDSPGGKEYRLPTPHEIEMAAHAEHELAIAFADVPFGLPEEPTPHAGIGAARAFSVDLYGLDRWRKLFLSRQLLTLATLIQAVRSACETIRLPGYETELKQAIIAALAAGINRIADRGSTLCRPDPTPTQSGIINTFSRFVLPMTWDFAEGVCLAEGSGGFRHSLEWLARNFEHASWTVPDSAVLAASAATTKLDGYDVVVTDPPYYDVIPYSDLMDFFYVWLRRTLHGLAPEFDAAFVEPLSPKWDHTVNDGEVIDDACRFGGDKAASKRNYEQGMARAFAACHAALKPDGRLMIVFAHKHPDAWETLVAAIIKAGFVVDGSWPIQTEMGNRTRALSSAALSSSVWLVCRKRDPLVRAGWDTAVLKEMHTHITQRLRDFWDAGIRGPDFVRAATGPALEAYSQYPPVKKASEPGQLMDVGEFLRSVRRIVVDFVVGRVLTRGESNSGSDHLLDEVTSYYLPHRHDFRMKDAPAGACILYAISCGLSERELADHYDILVRSKGAAHTVEDEDVAEPYNELEETASNSGGQFRLKPWKLRKGRDLGEETSGGKPPPLIDQIHRLMHLWQTGDVMKVNQYLDRRGLRRCALFTQLLQALIELNAAGDEERALLERLANRVRAIGDAPQAGLAFAEPNN